MVELVFEQLRDRIFEVLPFNPEEDPETGLCISEIGKKLGIKDGIISKRIWSMKASGYEINYGYNSRVRNWWRTVPLAE